MLGQLTECTAVSVRCGLAGLLPALLRLLSKKLGFAHDRVLLVGTRIANVS
jgi:hypothetical protein